MHERSIQFLLAEQRQIQESFWRNEESGEKRVNFFITLVTAVLAALVALATSKQGLIAANRLPLVVAYALLALLAFGLVTLLRMIRRNQVTDQYKRALDTIREYFKQADPALATYQPFARRRRRRLLTGGLVEMVSLVNSLILAALVGLWAFTKGWNSWLTGFGGFVFGGAFQLGLARALYKRTPFPVTAAEVEEEATLVVRSEEPERLLSEIAELHSLGAYALLPCADQAIRDRYFDTPDRTLSAKRVSLRVREVAGQTLLTLKGPGQQTFEGAARRRELELPWSRSALQRVLDALQAYGVRLQQLGGDPAAGATTALETLGLQTVQHRETHRKIRQVLLPKDGGYEYVAELALDSVVYHFAETDVRHYEIEIEAKSEKGAAAVRTLEQELLQRYPDALTSWPHSKLATGYAIAGLLPSESAAILGESGRVRPDAYPRIQNVLNQGTDS